MRNPTKKQGFTLLELLVTISIILVLAVIVTVSARNISESAKKVKHVSNLRQLWSTALMYASDNQGRLPPNKSFSSGTWQNHLVRWHERLSATETAALFTDAKRVEQSVFLQIFNSPLNKTKGNMGFGSGGWPTAAVTTEVFGRPLATLGDPSKSIALLPYYSDTKTLIGGNWQRPGGSVDDVFFDSKGLANCAFVDGSVSNITRESIVQKKYIYSYPSFDQPK